MPTPLYLWLMPPAPTQQRFAALIDRLSRRVGTPCFIPHVTLIGSLFSPESEVVRCVEQLASTLAPIPVRLAGLGWSDQYYRCLFMRAEPSAELLAAHREASDRLGVPPEADFFPHLSLIYGNLAENEKTQIVQEIGASFDVSFTAAQICLCRPVGSPEQWRLPYVFALTGRSDR